MGARDGPVGILFVGINTAGWYGDGLEEAEQNLCHVNMVRIHHDRHIWKRLLNDADVVGGLIQHLLVVSSLNEHCGKLTRKIASNVLLGGL